MNKKSIIFITCISLLTSACGNKNKTNKIEKNAEKIQEANLDENKSGKYLVSNMNDETSINFVKSTIEKHLNKKNGEVFASLVSDYNKSIPKELLSGDFREPPKEDKLDKILEMRSSIKHTYPDTNCRINSLLLLKDNLSLKEDIPIDDEILFMDKEALKSSNLFKGDELEKFYKLFSRVKTSSSKDPKVHAKVMEKFLSKFNFPKDVSMLSVIINDKLDGDYLFIGHVGVLFPLDDGYLFLEKISFEEPYQAIKFLDKKSCFKYLKNKFKDYTDPEVCPPFIMENDKYVEI
ncbi:DUF4300 family protein [Peptoniphilus vaginalis]|uniref:DUF4300 family protein n=1 Tax=Peptoniphilus vaginalis TaxID=1756987 RepID=UPI0023F80E54|nr:DUF4300 family protein [Peptoniphilus vaginalis]